MKNDKEKSCQTTEREREGDRRGKGDCECSYVRMCSLDFVLDLSEKQREESERAGEKGRRTGKDTDVQELFGPPISLCLHMHALANFRNTCESLNKTTSQSKHDAPADLYL